MTDNSGVMKHVLPTAAWAMLQAQPDAVLIDVRMEIESLYVGRPPGAINVPVKSSTRTTGTPLPSIVVAVLPVETISTP